MFCEREIRGQGDPERLQGIAGGARVPGLAAGQGEEVSELGLVGVQETLLDVGVGVLVCGWYSGLDGAQGSAASTGA